MTRMIERWFPCAEVSANSDSGWGSGNTERNLFTWFAPRPTAQAKAAVICSLLKWPDTEEEQKRLQELVKEAMTDRYATRESLRAEILKANPGGVSVLDPFSGRGMIPLEAARLGFQSFALDYAPVAVLGSHLLTDFPFRDWSGEPPLPFADYGVVMPSSRLLADLDPILKEIGLRFSAQMAPFYPRVNDRQPWGYLWAVTLPCHECGLRFPLVGSYELRRPSTRKARKRQVARSDPGQSFYVEVDRSHGTFASVVHDGPPQRTPTLTNAVDRYGKKIAGKAAICPFCGHVHPIALHRRLVNDGGGRDQVLVAADLFPGEGKLYRTPTVEEIEAADLASIALAEEPPFSPLLPAVPHERIAPGNNNIIGPSIYGARTYGDFMCDRQTLGFIRLARIISDYAASLPLDTGVSQDYARALGAYATSVLVRKVRRATRGCTLDSGRDGVHDIFANQGSITFSYDFFEAGLGAGPGTWESLADGTLSTLKNLLADGRGLAATVERGSATQLPYRDSVMRAVVTDPPYDQMIAYADSSDLLYAWIKRSLSRAWPDLAVTNDPFGAQEKRDEIIVKRVRGEAPEEHRTTEHYDRLIAQAFGEMRRVVADDGVVTIVFGHGEPEVWQRLLAAISRANLIMTGSWPANTEAGSHQGKANIETTLTMACRPAPAGRVEGRKAAVEAEIKEEIKARYPDWERWGLAPTDMLMAAAGPAMEVVGRFSRVLDARGEAVDISAFLPLARAAVQDAMAIEVDHHPLETFDARTRFALWWVRLYARQVVAKSELRWQVLAASMDLADVRDLVPDADKGCRFAATKDLEAQVTPESSVIDVAFAMAKASDEGLEAVGQTLLASGRDPSDAYLWASIKFLADRLPDPDPDAIAWTRLLRNRSGIGSATQAVASAQTSSDAKRKAEEAQMRLL